MISQATPSTCDFAAIAAAAAAAPSPQAPAARGLGDAKQGPARIGTPPARVVFARSTLDYGNDPYRPLPSHQDSG